MPELIQQFVTIKGSRLQYQWHGPRASDAPTIVFLHEGLGSIAQWRDFPAALCARTGYGGLVYNRQGHGGSEASRARPSLRYMHDEALEILPRLLDVFEIHAPVLLGHSDGASIALIYAGAQLGSPTALVLEAPHVFVEDITVRRIAEVSDAYRSTSLRERLARYHGGNVDSLFDRWSGTWLSAEFRGWNIEEYVSDIQCPMLVIQGTDDEYATLRQVHTIAACVAGRVDTLILEDCGHSPHVDQRSVVETTVAAFLDLRHSH